MPVYAILELLVPERVAEPVPPTIEKLTGRPELLDALRVALVPI
jgi:hypothetical protein